MPAGCMEVLGIAALGLSESPASALVSETAQLFYKVLALSPAYFCYHTQSLASLWQTTISTQFLS
jgi:hypothetical protein